jgi:type IV secretory pathway VirB10-like protein
MHDERIEPGKDAAAQASAPIPASAADRQVTMWNRKAVVILAGILAMTVMVVSFAFNGPRPQSASAAENVPAEELGDDAMRRSYLATPPDTAAPLGAAPSGYGAPAAFPVDAYAAGAGVDPTLVGTDPYAGGSASAAYAPPVEVAPAAPAAPPPPDPRELAFRRAMSCGIRSCPAPAEPQAAPVGSAVDPAAEVAQHLGGAAPAARAPGAAGGGTGDRYSAFLRQAGASGDDAPQVTARVQRPRSPYQVMAGTLIAVQLRTAINTDLPGEVVAQVTRNVYDSQQRHVLIPAGTRVLGRVDNQVGMGQARVNIAWYRLIFPNDHSLNLPGFTSADAQGAAGIRGKVNNHYGRTYLNAILLSAISAGAQLSQPRSGGSVLSTPSAGEVAAGALGQELGDVSQEMIRRNMQAGPTLEIPRDFAFTIHVSRDLALAPYPL